MRKFAVLSLLLVFATASFSQQLTPEKHSLTREDYLKKSKNQKKAGWIMLGGGAAIVATSLIIPEGESEGLQVCYALLCETHKNDGIKGGLAVVGTLSMLGSIPLFLASGKNKRRANAVSASFKTENASIVRGSSLIKMQYPALSIKIAFN